MIALQDARTGLAIAENMVDLHRPRNSGYCQSWHPLPCSVAMKAELVAAHWRTRVAYYEWLQSVVDSPTELMPVVTPKPSQRVWLDSLRAS